MLLRLPLRTLQHFQWLRLLLISNLIRLLLPRTTQFFIALFQPTGYERLLMYVEHTIRLVDYDIFIFTICIVFIAECLFQSLVKRLISGAGGRAFSPADQTILARRCHHILHLRRLLRVGIRAVPESEAVIGASVGPTTRRHWIHVFQGWVTSWPVSILNVVFPCLVDRVGLGTCDVKWLLWAERLFVWVIVLVFIGSLTHQTKIIIFDCLWLSLINTAISDILIIIIHYALIVFLVKIHYGNWWSISRDTTLDSVDRVEVIIRFELLVQRTGVRPSPAIAQGALVWLVLQAFYLND